MMNDPALYNKYVSACYGMSWIEKIYYQNFGVFWNMLSQVDPLF